MAAKGQRQFKEARMRGRSDKRKTNEYFTPSENIINKNYYSKAPESYNRYGKQ
jgi:hypothetical protein